MDRLEKDHDNLRAALNWSIENRKIESSARLSSALSHFWGLRGYLDEGRQWLDQVIPLLNTEALKSSIQAKVFMGAGMLAWQQGDYSQAARYMERSLEIARLDEDMATISRILQSLATIESARGNYARATAILEELLIRDRESGKTKLII